jgi:hypothetical protein
LRHICQPAGGVRTGHSEKEPVYDYIAKQGKIVLGHFPEYLSLATEIGAEVFNMPQDQWEKLDEEARWAANQEFLDAAIQRDDEIILSTLDVRRGSWFEKELRYLVARGYSPESREGRIVLARAKQRT